MRILMLSQFYPPIMGGIEQHVRNLSLELVSRGHQVSVATLWRQGQPALDLDGGVRVHRVKGSMQRLSRLFTTDRQHHPPFPDPEIVLALRRIVQEERPQIVHAHNWMVHSFLPLKQWSGARLVMTLHDCELACAQMRMMYRGRRLCPGPSFGRCSSCAVHHYGPMKGTVTLWSNLTMSRFQRSLVDMFLPVSGAVAEANGLTAGQSSYKVIPNFVPDSVASPPSELVDAESLLERLPREPFILQVGDLVADKGIHVLLRAYSGLAAPPPLVLIGRLMAESPTALPPGVTLIEGMPHPLVMEAWRRSLFGVVASTCLDACPTTTIEAMACGRAVVGSRIGGITDQIADGEAGLLVPPGDAEALGKAMARLIADPEVRQRMGREAAKRVIRFQCRGVVTAIEELYEHLCGESRAVAASGSSNIGWD